jgi:hypothetical protein
MADAQTISALFGDDIMQADAARVSTGNVSETAAALEGPGGPFDDMIPAKIENPDGSEAVAALSPGEFVLSQPIVEFLGDGDVEFGASLLGIMQNNGDALNEIKSVLKKYTA